MTLLDRFARTDETPSTPIHSFFAGLHLVLRGKLTKAQLKTLFNLDSTDDTQLDQLQTLFTNKSATEKAQMYNDLKAVMYLLEDKRITKQQAQTLLEL